MKIRFTETISMLIVLMGLFSATVDTKAEEVIFEMTNRKITAVDFKEPAIKTTAQNNIIFTGVPSAARSAIAIKYKAADWQGFECLKLKIKSDSPVQNSLRVAIRNGREYYKLEDSSLLPLAPAFKREKWQNISFELTNVPRDKNNELRIYLNFNKALTGKKLNLEISIALERNNPRIETLKSGIPRQRVLPKPYLAARGHVKYGLHINWFSDPDYFAERILMLDRSLEQGADINDPYGIGGKANFYRYIELMRMSGVCGMGMLNIDISSSYLNRTLNGMKYADEAGMKAVIVPEISVFSQGTGQEYLDKQIKNLGANMVGADGLINKLIPAAVKSESTYKFKGKTLISSYQACVQPPEFWGNYLQECRNKVGDKIIFLVELRTVFYNAMKRYHKNNGLSARELNEIRDYLNSYLRVCDGIHFAGQNHLVIPGTKYFYRKFYDGIVIPLINEVMCQPQNRNKLLGLGIAKGYINHLASSVQSEAGTDTLRTGIESALSINPDYLLLVEWNEIKERTNLEPTIADGRSSMRILRYYFSKLKGEINTPLPGDNTACPNFILSYRPQLSPGEAMDFEILYVPDSAEPANDEFKVKLELLNLNGKVVKTFAEQKMPSRCINNLNVKTYADSTLAPEFILLPRLTIVSSNGKHWTFDKGFPYINISANELRDEKYYKVPVRDLPEPRKCEFSAELKNGKALVKADIKGEKKIAFVEVLRNRRPVFNPVKDTDYALGEGESLIKISWNGWKEARASFPCLKIKLSAGEIRSVTPSNRGWGRDFSFKLVNKQEVNIDLNKIAHGARRGIYLIVKGQIGNLNITAGKSESRISFDELKKNGIYRLCPGDGLNILVEDFKRIPDLPPYMNSVSCNFSELIPDINSRDVVSLRYICTDGSIYRSKPVIFEDLSKTIELSAWDDKNNTPGKITAAQAAVEPLAYNFDPSPGTILKAPGFDSRYYAQLGGSTNYGDSFFLRNNFPANSRLTAPVWSKDNDGQNILIFDGMGNHLVVPLYATPAGAFTFQFDIKPESLKPQILLRSYSKTAGALLVVLQENKLDFQFVNHDGKITKFTTPELFSINKWCNTTIAFDLKQFKIKVNDSKVYSYPCIGKPNKMTQMVFGGVGNAKHYGYFKGALKSLKIYYSSTL